MNYAVTGRCGPDIKVLGKARDLGLAVALAGIYLVPPSSRPVRVYRVRPDGDFDPEPLCEIERRSV